MFKRLATFFKGVEYEMKKVSWPTVEELRGSTVVVLVLSFILVIFLFAVDLGLSTIVAAIL